MFGRRNNNNNNNSLSNSRKRATAASATPGGPVGTEALAAQNLETNAKQFQYPPQGFESGIEHTLLYSLITAGPKVFPHSVVLEAIQQEDMEPYLYARPPKGSNEPYVSYSQLSALMVLAGTHWEPQHEIAQTLCKKILRVVIRHAEQEGLDRQEETQELLKPVLEYAQQKEQEEAMAVIAPIYVGWAASMVTGNPLPLLASYAVSTHNISKNSAQETDRRNNLSQMVQTTERSGNIEQASLLEEYDDE